MIVDVTYRFRMVDRDQFEAMFARLVEIDTAGRYSPDWPVHAKAEALLTCLDVLSRDVGSVLGWEDLGLERIH